MFEVDTVFLDRDGVINRKQPHGEYVLSWEEFEFLPGAVAALVRLAASGKRLLVVTNQRAVARGLLSDSALNAIHARMEAALASAGASLAAVYYCPHDIGQCSCRKPDVGLFVRAQCDFPEISFARSVVIGDSSTDIVAGRRLGCHTVRIRSAPSSTVEFADAEATSLFDAVARFFRTP